MVNIQNAISFVKENGDEIEKTRMKCILIGEGAPNDILTELSKIQNPDGGFSYWTKGFSTVFDTIYVLSWLDDLQEQKGEIVDNAFNFLISKQHSDGGWDEVEAPKSSDETSNLISGEEETRAFLTAYAAHWFVRFGRVKELLEKRATVDFLQTYLRPSGLILDDFQASWDGLVLFSYQPGLDSELFNDSLDVIEKKLNPDICMGSDLAYLLCCLRDAGLEAYHPFVNLCIDELMQKQNEDGSWESEYGEKYATDATIVALRGLKHYNVV